MSALLQTRVMKENFRKWANQTSNFVAKPIAFMLALAVVLLWVVAGPFFGWSEQHQLIINTLTTIITFLMTFLLRGAEDRGTRAIQLKLNELILSVDRARNQVIGAENASDRELDDLKQSVEEALEEAKACEREAEEGA